MLSVLSNDFGLKNLRKLVSLKKIPEIFGIRASTSRPPPKKRFDSCSSKLQKNSCKAFPSKTYLRKLV